MSRLMEEKYKRPDLTAIEKMSLAGRGLNVLSELLGGISQASEVTKVTRWCARLGQAIVGVTRILTPGAPEGPLFRHWFPLAVLIDIVLIVVGIFYKPAMEVGLYLTGATMLVGLAVETARLACRPSGVLWRLVALWVSVLSATGAATWAYNHSRKDGKPVVSFDPATLMPWQIGFIVGSIFAIGIVWRNVVSSPRDDWAPLNLGSLLGSMLKTAAPLLLFVGATLGVFQLFDLAGNAWVDPALLGMFVVLAALTVGALFSRPPSTRRPGK